MIVLNKICHITLFSIIISILLNASFENPTISSMVFDVYIFIIIGIVSSVRINSLKIGRITMGLVFIAVIYSVRFYILTSETYLGFNSAMYEYARSIRFLFYMIMFSFLISNFDSLLNSNVVEGTVKLFYFMLLFFTVFYFFQMTVLNDNRPQLYAENNYEIPSLLIFYLFVSSYLNLPKSVSSFVVIISTVSLSKSGVLSMLYTFTFARFNVYNVKRIAYLLMSVTFFSIIVLNVFLERFDDLDIYKLDRFRFLVVLIELFNGFTFLELIFGKGIASLLPYKDCLVLNYWANAISGDYAYCNAQTFHSFFMRIFYEFGVVGGGGILFTWYKLLTIAFGRKIGISFFIIISICSLSVSGFSNSIVIWPIFYMFIVKSNFKKYNSKFNEGK